MPYADPNKQREYFKNYDLLRRDLPQRKADRRRMSRESYLRHKEEVIARTMRRYAENPRARKNREFKREYGITLEEYERLCVEQGGKCAICGTVPKTLYVDHDHQTKKFRGLVCMQCNLGIGYLKDNPNIVGHALTYLLEAEG
jgi:hypothetical protein